jgi:hypothetical protein
VRIIGEGNVDTDPGRAVYLCGEEVALASLLLKVYRRRLRAIVASAPN